MLVAVGDSVFPGNCLLEIPNHDCPLPSASSTRIIAAMSQEIWSAVERYFTDLLVQPDCGSDGGNERRR